MEKRLSGIDQFFRQILPQAQFGSHWDKEMILQAMAWGRMCQKMFDNLTSECEYSSKVLCKCSDAVIATTSTPASFHRKSFSLSDNNAVARSSICKDCGLKKQHLKSSNQTLKSKSLWQKKEVTSVVSSVLIDLGYSLWQMEDCVLLLMSKLLLNQELSLEQQEMVREAVEESLKETERKSLWLLVDQIKANKENLNVLVESAAESSWAITSEGALVQEGLNSALETAIRYDQLPAWMKHHLNSDRLLFNAPAQDNEKHDRNLRSPNFLYRLLSVVSVQEDVGLSVLNWLTSVHGDAGHDCHALLLNQWLCLFWFNTKMSKSSIGRGKKCFNKSQPHSQGLTPCLSGEGFPVQLTNLISLGSISEEESCFCRVVSTVLVSLLKALFEACSVGLQYCDADTDPKWVIRGTNPNMQPSTMRVCCVDGVSIPSLLTVNNLAHFIRSLRDCSNTDCYSACTPSAFKRIVGDVKRHNKLHGGLPIAHYHSKLRSILRKSLTVYICSTQGSLWSEVMQKSEAHAFV